MLVGGPMCDPLTFTSADGTPLSARYWPVAPPAPAVVIVHGLGSRKDNHADFARACQGSGLAALTFDLRGHGASGGNLGAGALDDVLAAVQLVADRGHRRVGLRGSSLGGFLALAAAARGARVACVVAICPARPEALAARLDDPWPIAFPLGPAVARHDGVARGYWHATGDDRVPWAATAQLAQMTPQPRTLRIVLGGSHQSLQHDPRIIAETRDFLARHLC